MTDKQIAVHKWLYKLRYMEHRLENVSQYRLRIERLYCRATGTAPNLDGLPHGSGSGSRLENAVIEMIRLEELLAKQADVFAREWQARMNAIDAVQDDTLHELLECRYLLYYSFERTAARMHYSEQHLKRLAPAALDAVLPFTPIGAQDETQ